MRRVSFWACWGGVVLGLGSAPGLARAQWGRSSSAGSYPASSSASPGSSSRFGFGTSPITNPYLNPYANPYLYYAPQGGVGAAMVFMAAQQAQADAARGRAEAAEARTARQAPVGGTRSAMVPGGGASRYFGGSNGTGPTQAPGSDGAKGGHYGRHDRYFHPNGY